MKEIAHWAIEHIRAWPQQVPAASGGPYLRDCTQAVLVSAKARTKSGSNQGTMSPFSLLFVPSEYWGHLQIRQKTLRKFPAVLKVVK